MSDERGDQEFRRITGKNVNGAIYFLPWRTNFQTALTFGLVSLEDWWLCYELPTDVVAAEPRRCAAAIRSLIDDAASQIERHGLPTVFVGLSMGSVPATFLAAQYRQRLWSFASADRGDLMIWQSPAAQHVRRQARRRGFGLSDFTVALEGLNPIDNIDRIATTSRFAVGSFDRYIPRRRRTELVRRATQRVPIENITFEPLGHLGVMALSSLRQLQWSRAA